MVRSDKVWDDTFGIAGGHRPQYFLDCRRALAHWQHRSGLRKARPSATAVLRCRQAKWQGGGSHATDVLGSQEWARKLDTFSAEDRIRQLRLCTEQRDLLNAVLCVISHSEPRAGRLLSQIHWWALSEYDFGRMVDRCGRYKLAQGSDSLVTAMLNDSRAELSLATPVRPSKQTRSAADTEPFRTISQFSA
jgi:hypothetical protein